MLSEKKVSKKSPSKMNISSVLEQIGLLSRGKVSICSQGFALGGIAERPLTTRMRIISGVAGHQRCSAAAYDGESWGVWGQSPREPGCRDGVPAGCGQSPRFVLVIKRKLPPCGRHLPLNPLYGIFLLSRSGRIFSINLENLHPTLDNIRLFSRSEDREQTRDFNLP